MPPVYLLLGLNETNQVCDCALNTGLMRLRVVEVVEVMVVMLALCLVDLSH